MTTTTRTETAAFLRHRWEMAGMGSNDEQVEKAARAEACEHFWLWVSPAGARGSARLCTFCRQPDPDWLNEIDAAGVPALRAEVERLRRVGDQTHRETLRTAANYLAERDEALRQVADLRALVDGWAADGPVDSEPGLRAFLDRARAALAGSGEQPGETHRYIVQEDDWRECSRCGHRYQRWEPGRAPVPLGVPCRPAPVVPDSTERCGAWGGCTLPRGHNRGRADVPSNHSVPDSTDVREALDNLRAFALMSNATGRAKIDAWHSTVLAVVGQGVTAEHDPLLALAWDQGFYAAADEGAVRNPYRTTPTDGGAPYDWTTNPEGREEMGS